MEWSHLCATPSVKRGSLSISRKGKIMSRLDTMAQRIEKDLPEFIKLIPPTTQSEGLYRRIRHIQKTGECCGFKMTIAQLKEIIALAGRESVHNKICYLCRILDRVHVERTLKTAQNRLNIDSRIENISHYIKIEAEWQIKYISDLISDKYSMNDLMCACEIAMKKENPVRYFIKMVKNGIKIGRLCYN